MFNMEAAVRSSDEHQLWDDLKNFLNYDNSSYDYADNEADICDLGEGKHFKELFIPVAYSVVFLLGILANGFLLGILIKSRKSWSVTDTFILHLAVANILLLVTLPLWAVKSASSFGWVFGTPLCKVAGSVFRILSCCVIFLLACTTLDCYLSTVHSAKLVMQKKPWVAHACCVVVWIFSLILSIPDWLFLETVKDERQNREVCIQMYSKPERNNQDMKSLNMAARWPYHAVGFLLPLVVLIFCYSCVLWKWWCCPNGIQKQRHFKTITALVAAFLLCWTPFNITLMAETFRQITSVETSCKTKMYLDKALTVTFVLGFFYCCLLPTLYVLIDVKIQHQVRNLWGMTSETTVF